MQQALARFAAFAVHGCCALAALVGALNRIVAGVYFCAITADRSVGFAALFGPVGGRFILIIITARTGGGTGRRKTRVGAGAFIFIATFVAAKARAGSAARPAGFGALRLALRGRGGTVAIPACGAVNFARTGRGVKRGCAFAAAAWTRGGGGSCLGLRRKRESRDQD